MGEMGGMIFFWIIAMAGIFFFMGRNQRKEKARLRAMLAEMAVGDTVLTTSGFYGVLIDVQEEDVIVEFGNNKNCRIPMQKSAITQIEKPNTEQG